MSESPMLITGVASYFGSNRSCAEQVGTAMGPVPWVAIPFAGSMCEVPHLKASQVLVNDLNRNLITTARVIADPVTKDVLVQRLIGKLVHPDELLRAQRLLFYKPAMFETGAAAEASDIDVAEAYFVINWMGRSGVAGTDGEASVGLAVRYDAGGGCPAKRYRSAVESVEAWHRQLARCTFTVEDFAAFIERVPDRPHASAPQGVPPRGIYCDPPFPGPGDAYTHTLSQTRQHELARMVARRKHTRVLMRFYDHELVRELYPEGEPWVWLKPRGGKDQHRKDKPEVLIWNGV